MPLTPTTILKAKNGLQQLQMESCQPIKRLKDKKNLTKNYTYPIGSGGGWGGVLFVRYNTQMLRNCKCIILVHLLWVTYSWTWNQLDARFILNVFRLSAMQDGISILHTKCRINTMFRPDDGPGEDRNM